MLPNAARIVKHPQAPDFIIFIMLYTILLKSHPVRGIYIINSDLYYKYNLQFIDKYILKLAKIHIVLFLAIDASFHLVFLPPLEVINS